MVAKHNTVAQLMKDLSMELKQIESEYQGGLKPGNAFVL